MANKTTMKEEYKDDKTEMLEKATETLVKVGKGIFIVGAVGLGMKLVYTFGKQAGNYEILEWVYKNVPESAEAIKKFDPAFFAIINQA